MDRSRARRPGVVAVVGIPLAALAAGTFVSVGIGVLAPDLRDDLGFSRTGIGVLTALVAAGSALASRRAGRLTDALGPVRVLAASLLLVAAAAALVAVSPVAGFLMATVFILGLAYGGINPPTNVVVAGQMAPGRLGLLMSVKQTGVPVGVFLAGLVLPAVAVALDWRFAFGIGALLTLLVAASTLWLRGVAVAPSRKNSDDPASPSRVQRWSLAGYGFVMAGSQWVFLTYLVLYLSERQGWSLQAAGLALSLATAFSVGGRLFWGWISDRPGRRVTVLAAASAIAASMLTLLAVGVSGPTVWLVAAVAGAGLVGWNGVFHALVVDRAERESLGRASGEVMALVFAGAVCLPPLFGFLSEQFDSWSLLWALTAGAVGSAGLVLRAALREERPPSLGTRTEGSAR